VKYKFETKDKMEALRLSKSFDMALVFFEIGNLRRAYLKYDDKLNDGEYRVAEAIFDDIQKLINKHGIIVDELIE